MPEKIGTVSVFGLHPLLEKLKEQLDSGDISLKEYEETRTRLEDEAALLYAKPARTKVRNKVVLEGHDEHCTCFTCFRANY